MWRMYKSRTNSNLLLCHSLKTTDSHYSNGLFPKAILSHWIEVMIFPDTKQQQDNNPQKLTQGNIQMLFLSLNSIHNEYLPFHLQSPLMCCLIYEDFFRFVKHWLLLFGTISIWYSLQVSCNIQKQNISVRTFISWIGIKQRVYTSSQSS